METHFNHIKGPPLNVTIFITHLRNLCNGCYATGGHHGRLAQVLANSIALINIHTVKPVLSGHSKIDKTKVLKTNGSLMKVESIAECSLGAFCNTYDLH